ncbi:MAG: hypothetical protein A2X08_12185 [Bacteroidetes bacterium GWA2_32_17]|nr:MAG: hypothetical protein A2X08_12185 [Bacteroidetes bacterium GWA2_32_17]
MYIVFLSLIRAIRGKKICCFLSLTKFNKIIILLIISYHTFDKYYFHQNSEKINLINYEYNC